MKQVKTTIILSAFAAVSLVLALSVYYFGPKNTDSQNELIGEVFFPEFTDPAQASSMTLIVWDGKEKETKEFEIKKVKQTRTVDGKEKEVELWAMPAHNNYPVESPDTLRETAGSVMNIERLSLETISKEEHERLGVIDPKDKDAKLKEPNQVGDRIVLTDDSGNTVCDLIIGNAVDAEAENEISDDERQIVQGERYFVRQPDQNEVYVARLDLQITTDFSEWIDDDLLQIEDASVKQIQFLNYGVKEQLIEAIGGAVPVRQGYEDLIVKKVDGSWDLFDLKADTEELDSSTLDTLEKQFQSLSILEVQPKPTYQDNDMRILNPDLSVNAPKGMSRGDQIRIQQQVLGPQGFIIGLEDEKKVEPSLLSTNGELKFATDDGLVYHMFFGYDVKLEGDQFEFAGADNADNKKPGEDGKDEENKGADSNADDKSQKGKIMSVHVSFDQSLIERPTPPEKPVPPEKPNLGLPVPNPADPGKSDDKKVDPKKDAKEAGAPNSKSAGDLNSEPKAAKSKAADKKTEEPKKAESKKVESSKDSENPDSKTAESKSEKDGCDDGFVEDLADDSAIQEEDQEGKQDDTPKKAAKQEEKKDVSPKQEEPKKQESKKTDDKNTPKKDSKKTGDKSEPKKSTEPKVGKQEDDAKKGEGAQGPENQDPPMKTPEDIFTEKMQAYDAAMRQHEIAMEEYETKMEDYKEALKEYDKKVEASQKKVAELNERFADWFYIVDAADLEKVKLTRADIVKPKEKKEDAASGAPVPNIPGLNGIPGLDGKLIPKGPEKNSEPKKVTPKKEEPKKAEQDKKGDPKKEETNSKEDPESKNGEVKKEPKTSSQKEAKEDSKSAEKPAAEKPAAEKPAEGKTPSNKGAKDKSSNDKAPEKK